MQLNKEQLRLFRNAIYASKGYVFKSNELNEFFKQSSNYVPDGSLREEEIEFTIQETRLLEIIKELEAQ